MGLSVQVISALENEELKEGMRNRKIWSKDMKLLDINSFLCDKNYQKTIIHVNLMKNLPLSR